MSQFWDKFDRILLATLFILSLAAAMFIMFYKGDTMDEGTADWARSMTNLILGGLLGLVTGRALEQRAQAKETEKNEGDQS